MACNYLHGKTYKCVMRPDLRQCPYTWWCDWENRQRIKDKWQNCQIAKRFEKDHWLRVVKIESGKLYYLANGGAVATIPYHDRDKPIAVRWGDNGVEEKILLEENKNGEEKE